MSPFERSCPSPAMVVAIAALLLALAGSAVAGTSAVTRDLSKSQVKKVATKQAKKAIKKAAPGLSVAKSQNAVNAQNAAQAQNATSAQRAVIGAPAAFAHITGAADVDPGSPSKNITSANVNSGATGAYCFDLPFAPLTAAANANNQTGGTDQDGILAYNLNPSEFGVCPASAEAEVTNVDASDGLAQNEEFNIQFDG